MNAPHSPSLLASVPMAPSDPILGVTDAFAADPNPRKVNLGVGVYYDAQTRGLDFAGMERALGALPAGSIVVLHACCHNPTGVDLSREQWSKVLDIVMSRGLVPFLDLAYQGFADGLEADGYAARLFAGAMTPVFLSSSFSKSFSLYGERVGALSVVSASAEEASR